MLASLLVTDQSKTLATQRWVLAAVMAPHGAQKLLGWFGGYGLNGTMSFFTENMHIPAPLALLVIAAESLGAVALAVGLGTRVAALGIAATMVGAVLLTHLPNGFFMNWYGQQGGEGFEYHLLALGLAAPLIVRGAGAWSLDAALASHLARGRDRAVTAVQPASL